MQATSADTASSNTASKAVGRVSRRPSRSGRPHPAGVYAKPVRHTPGGCISDDARDWVAVEGIGRRIRARVARRAPMLAGGAAVTVAAFATVESRASTMRR